MIDPATGRRSILHEAPLFPAYNRLRAWLRRFQVTIEERFERIEHVTAGLAEERRKDREENRQIWRDTQRQINELTLKIADTNDSIARLGEETREAIKRLAEESREADRR